MTGDIVGRGHVPVTLGGEHSLSYGAVMGVVDALAAQGQGPVGLVHIDAHADFRDAYQGNKHSHASVMHLLAAQGLPMASFGVRALAEEEERARRAHGVVTFDGPDLVRGNISDITLPETFPENIYVTLTLMGWTRRFSPPPERPCPAVWAFIKRLIWLKRAGRAQLCRH